MRLFTFFIYLRSPESGGATHFPSLNVTIAPKAGSALLWPNVQDHDVRMADMRTEHEAQPPHQGRKFSANLWLHQYDFRGPNVRGCDMGRRVTNNKAQEYGLEAVGDAAQPGGAAKEAAGGTGDEEADELHVEL